MYRDIQWRVVGFGFLLTLSSAFGQTHFLSLFNVQLRSEFSLSNTEIGGIYSAATLCSAILLTWLGRQLDLRDLRWYTMAVITGLAAAALILANATSLVMLFIAFFMLRLCGQGLSSHTGMTVTARLATQHRGKSLSLASLGFSAGEGIAPLAVGALLVSHTWREVWIGSALVELIIVLLLAQWLLRGLEHRPPAQQLVSETGPSTATGIASWNRRQVLTDLRFWRVIPALSAPPFIVTALLFHQSSLAEFKEVDFRFWTAGFVAYSVTQVGMALVSGHLVDRIGCVQVIKIAYPFILIALLLPISTDFTLLPFVYYGFIGTCIGLLSPATTALWREIYGPDHLGANLAMSQALNVLASAAGPVVVGLLLDAPITWSIVLTLCFAYICSVYVLLLFTQLRPCAPPRHR